MSRLDEKYRYYAFISYNHKDEREAKWLQRQLEHYRLPSVARKEIGEDVKMDGKLISDDKPVDRGTRK